MKLPDGGGEQMGTNEVMKFDENQRKMVGASAIHQRQQHGKLVMVKLNPFRRCGLFMSLVQ